MVAVLFAFPPAGAAAQGTASADAVAIAGDLRTLRPQTANPDLAVEAVLALTAILDQLDAVRDREGRLPEIETELFLRALEYRARAHVTRESREQASDDLRLLILADPTWRLDVAGLSPAVLDLFEQQRGELLAYLTVLTEPAGVTVLVEDEPVGATPLTGRPVFAGLVTIRLERPGFTVYSEPRREVLAGEMISIEHEMERSHPVLSVITSPAGVTVRVGGRVAGVTGGSLPEDLRPLVPPRFARDEFSAPLQLGNLETGANEITLEAPCRTPSRFTFHADEARDYLPRFVRLRPSTGGLRIESEPGGATVVLDGEERGVTPLSFSAMCSGEHEVEIRHPAGRCARSFTVSRGSRTAVSCEVLPVLAMTPSEPEGASDADRAVRRVLEARDQIIVEYPVSFRRYNVKTEWTIVLGALDPRQARMYEVARRALAEMTATARPGRRLGEIFEAHARILDEGGYARHRYGACGYSVGVSFPPTSMDVPPMIYPGAALECAPGMTLFYHVMITDTDTGLAMGVGHTLLVTGDAPEILNPLPDALTVKA